ncbi:hypothetical protein ACI79J_15380 [Geodermatophilus sp. SYSU D01062]
MSVPFGPDQYAFAAALVATLGANVTAVLARPFRLAGVLPAVSPCVYFAVDEAGALRYIGKVHRQRGGLRSRFSRHHARTDSWHAVWILPFDNSSTDARVTAAERTLIQYLQPPDNGLSRPA